MRKRIAEWCRQRAKLLEIDIYALYLAYKDPRVPLYAKLVILAVVGYVYSPIDLIPDLVPVIGLLDDLIVISLGIWLIMVMIPPPILHECRIRAQIAINKAKPDVRIASSIITILFLLAVLAVILLPRFRGK